MKFLVIVLSGILIANCTHIIYGFTYLGCIYDDNLRVLPYEQLILKKRMTTENCIDHCLSFNIYDYAGTEYYKHCFCGLSDSSSAFVFHNESDCSSPCTGNSSQMCGGYWRLSVYQLFTNGFTYLGCIYDDNLRVLPYEQLILKKRMTTENCIDHCLSFNIYDYAGTEYYKHCFCGLSDSSSAFVFHNESDCSSPCTGNSSQMCGGYWRLSVYQLFTNDYTYIGCVVHSTTGSTLIYNITLENVMTTQICIHHCRSYMYMYAGLRNSTECYCGKSGLNFIFVNEAECSIACAGAGLEKCGSEWRLSMYILTVLEMTTQQLEATTTDDVPSSSNVTLDSTVNDVTDQQLSLDTLLPNFTLHVTTDVSQTGSSLNNITAQNTVDTSIVGVTVGQSTESSTSDIRSQQTAVSNTLATTTSHQITSTNLQYATSRDTRITTSAPSPTVHNDVDTAVNYITNLLKETTSISDITLSQDECRCPCSNLPPSSLANMTINELVKRATKDLVVNKNATSKYRFSKISAPDDRRSSSGMGFVAILITSMPIILIIAVDLSNLYAWQKEYVAKI